MTRSNLVCLAAAIAMAIGLLAYNSHWHLGIFWTEDFIPWLGITVACTGASCRRGALKSLRAAVFSENATAEEREQAARVIETAGRVAHAVAAFVSLISVLTIFGALGHDIHATGEAMAFSLLTMLYSIVLSEFILAPLHGLASPGTRWPHSMMIASSIFMLAVLATIGFGAFACCPK